MKFGARKPILLALYIFSLLCFGPIVRATWNTNAWPTTNSFRLAPTNFFVATNIYGQLWEDTWTQTASTNTIPQINDFSSYTNGFAYTNIAIIGTNQYTNIFYDFEYTMPIGAYTGGSSRVITNAYLKNLRPDMDPNELLISNTLSQPGHPRLY